MKKIKNAVRHVTIWFFFGMIGFMSILLLTGAFRFAATFIDNTTPGFIEWLGMIFVVVIAGTIGLVWFIYDTE